MTKYVDAISRYIDPLINKYLVAVFITRDNNIRQRSFAYNFDVFLHCLNPRHVRHVDLLPEHLNLLTVPTLLVLYHAPIHFSLSCSFIYSVLTPFFLSRIVVPHEDIMWLSFDSVIN